MNNDYTELEKMLQKYPFNMQAKDVANFLNISPNSVYTLIKRNDFPSIQLPGSRLHFVPKDKFMSWYLSLLEVQNDTTEHNQKADNNWTKSHFPCKIEVSHVEP